MTGPQSGSVSVASDDSFRFELPQIGDSEEVEFYRPGGFHPVHLGDVYDGSRYRVAHKLGAGGYSTVWLARDTLLGSWVALKIIVADKSSAVEAKAVMCGNASRWEGTRFVTYTRLFHIAGPNGRHLCLVLPLCGPSTYQMSQYLKSRMHPGLARRVSLQAAMAVADVHYRGICHGDITPSNVVFRLRNLDHLNDAAIYRLFGEPRTDELRTCSGEMHGPEAPRYIVGYLDFFASDEDLILDDVYLIDFDQSFHESTPPAKKPGIPIGFLAPEVAVGQPAGRASDVWALGCTMLHLRSGESPFANMDVDAPSTLMRWVIKYLGAMPASWGEPLFDPSNGHLADAGCPVDIAEEPRSLFLGTFVAAVWDLPSASVLEEMRSSDVDRTVVPEWDENKPYPECYAGRFWKPAAIRAHGTYLDGYCDQVDVIIQTLPKIGMREADLLVDLVERIFVYDPAERLGLDDILRHSWLHASETVDGF